MFFAGAEVGHDIQIILGTCLTPETAGYVFLRLYIAKVAFRLVITLKS